MLVSLFFTIFGDLKWVKKLVTKYEIGYIITMKG